VLRTGAGGSAHRPLRLGLKRVVRPCPTRTPRAGGGSRTPESPRVPLTRTRRGRDRIMLAQGCELGMDERCRKASALSSRIAPPPTLDVDDHRRQGAWAGFRGESVERLSCTRSVPPRRSSGGSERNSAPPRQPAAGRPRHPPTAMVTGSGSSRHRDPASSRKNSARSGTLGDAL